ncbi:hypothetical protein [Oryza sativa Japonica Group]|uniref:Uncharacterized protein n=1 Tax=Oryza sativa subsp. japonica TaxID=39947 RepID=Q8RV66_ORYSJ|nr:hypothetical protein [Oryza sativa Japonica Group]BAB86488.1 hypothetical protein [Oryza sativa Japonica Group]
MASRKSLRRSALLQLPCGCFAETRVVLDEKTEHLQLPPTRTRCHDENSVYANLLSNIGFNTGLEVCKALKKSELYGYQCSTCSYGCLACSSCIGLLGVDSRQRKILPSPYISSSQCDLERTSTRPLGRGLVKILALLKEEDANGPTCDCHDDKTHCQRSTLVAVSGIHGSKITLAHAYYTLAVC